MAKEEVELPDSPGAPIDYKAVPHVSGIDDAVKIWKRLEVDKYTSQHPKAMSEEEISIATWEGCDNPSDFAQQFKRWKRWNTRVIEQMGKRKSGEKILPRVKRLWVWDGAKMVTKICKPLLKELEKGIHTDIKKISTIGGKAALLNEEAQLGIPVISSAIENQMAVLTNAGYAATDAAQIAQETNKAIYAQLEFQKLAPEERRKYLCQGILDLLDDNPEIKKMDEKYEKIYGSTDKLSYDAQKKRAQEEAK